MIAAGSRATLKRIVPRSVWVSTRRLATYLRRLRTWLAVARQIKGCTDKDRRVIRLSIRQGLITGFSNLDTWQDPELVADACVSVGGIGTFAVRGFSDDLYHVLPSREAPVLAALRQRLTPGGVFVDAGANIGFFTVVASRLIGADGRAFAIEMMPNTAERLRHHIHLNRLSNVIVFEHALSNVDGHRLTARVPPSKYGRASIVRSACVDFRDEVNVVTRRLDTLLGGFPLQIDVLKMDIEGAEALALEGGRKVLAQTKSVIFEQLEGEKSAAAILSELSFQLRRLDATNVLAERKG